MIRISEQGALQLNKLINLFSCILLFVAILPQNIYAETQSNNTALQKTPLTHNVFILSSSDNSHHISIVDNILNDSNLKNENIIVSVVPPDNKIDTIDHTTDIIIAIGRDGMISADKEYPDTKKLFISTDPHRYRLDKDINKNDAILYMTQPFCRQIGFIKHLNQDWKTISILNSQNKPVNAKTIQQCANSFDIKAYIVSTTVKENLTNKIKHALNHSDVLLAHPDSTIYNRKNIKNILLTSYRYRKPVIGFSENFVTAGALASINSDTEQIAKSAIKLIAQYFSAGNRFSNQVNYPLDFDININRQVSRALNITIPDIDILKSDTMQEGKRKKGESL